MSPTDSSQALLNLARADEVRLARAAVKRSLKAGEMTMAEALEKDCTQTMEVYRLMKAQWFCGPQRATALLKALGIPLGARVGELQQTERWELGEACRHYRRRVQA